tara:strand:- start:13 stop:1008 length:996 start_codon:yes stop_codon:yes gene_type:complete
MISGLALKVGFADAIQKSEDRQAAKEERIQKLNDAKRQWLFTTYQEGKSARAKSVTARKSMIKKAMGIGFSKEAAYLLESSGELGEQLSRITKLKDKGKFNQDKVTLMSEMVTDTLKGRPKEKQIAALKYIAQGDLNFSSASEFEDEFINAIFSADPDSLGKATKLYSNVMAGGGGGGLDFGSSGLSTRAFGDYDTTLRAGVDKLIASKVQGFFGENTITIDDGSINYKGANGRAAQKLFNDMSKIVEDNYYDPSVGGDWKAVVNVMADNLSKQANSDIKVGDYKISVDPNFDISTVVRTLPPESQDDSTPSSVENMTKEDPLNNTLGGAG